MKTRKNAFLKLIAIPFSMMVFMIAMFFLCDSNVKAASDTTVALKQGGQNVKVSINPKEGASIASFQIGLKIEASKASDIKNVTFNWADIGSAKLKRESYDKEKGILNLYVVTEAEQNTGSAIEVGTIKIETSKNTKVTVSPIADKTTASSIAHKETKVEAKYSDKITYTANTSGGNQGGSSTGDNNQGGNTGDNNQSGNQGGSNGSGNQGDNSSGNQGGGNSGNSGNQGGNTSGSGNNSGSSSTGNGNGSNSGDNTDNEEDEDKDKDEGDEKNDDENNVEDNNEIDNSASSNQVENVATGALPQTGEKDNFIVLWVVMALVVLVGVLLAFGYKSKNKKDTFKL